MKVLSSFKKPSAVKRKASTNLYQLIDYEGDTILTHTSDFAYNKIVLGDKIGIAEILGSIINNSFVSNKIVIKEM